MFKNITFEKYPLLIAAKPWHRYAVSALLVASLTMAWFLFLYAPLKRKYDQVNAQIYAYQKDISMHVQEQEKHKQTEREVAHLASWCDAYGVMHSDAPKKIIELIAHYVQLSNLQLQDMHQIKAVDKLCHTTTGITLQAKGTLHDIQMFLYALEKERLVMRCSQLHIMYEQHDIYTLQLTFKVVVFKKNESPSTLEKKLKG